ncbi:MAG: hypothetical protein ACTSQJ_00650 [Promethearchaeota archaeon]
MAKKNLISKKGPKRKKVDVRKKREKILKERKKKLPKDIIKQELEKKEASKSEKERKLEIRLQRETHLYWIRAITGALSALVGRLVLGLIGWSLFFWMLFFWFVFPFIVNKILKYKYEEEEWTWKNVIKPGIGIFFFLFMIISVLIHTMLAFYA